MGDPNTTDANTGLSEDAASGLAYLTFIPAIIFWWLHLTIQIPK